MNHAIRIYNRKLCDGCLKSSNIYASNRKVKTEYNNPDTEGILFHAEILEITRSEKEVTCAVKKDGGDDPDITSGALIFSTVSFADEEEKTLKQHNGQLSGICVEAMQEKQAVIHIDGGKGVGRVTKPGLDQPVGNAPLIMCHGK